MEIVINATEQKNSLQIKA